MNTFKQRNPDVPYFFKMSVAGKRFEVECFNKYVGIFCKDYLSGFEEPDFIVGATIEEIREEAVRIFGESVFRENINENVAVEYVDSESKVILRKIACCLIRYNIVLFHGAAIAVDDKCYIFTAPSGTGKTTHICHWLDMIPNTVVVNGDKPFVDVERKIVYASPWCGKEGLNTNISMPLSGIILLERGEVNRMKRIDFKKAYPQLVNQVYIPENITIKEGYSLIGKIHDVPFYKLICNKDKESAIVAYRGLTGAQI